jgi:hypothetical protein
MTPEAIKASLQAARNFDPAQLAQMQQMMGSGMGGMGGMGGMPQMPPGGMGGMGGMGGGMGGGLDNVSPESAAAMLGGMSPQMMEQAANMIKSLEPEAMAAMLSGSMGRTVTPAEAKSMQVRAARAPLGPPATPRRHARARSRSRARSPPRARLRRCRRDSSLCSLSRARAQEQLAKVDPVTMQRWVARAAVGFGMWTWLKTSVRLLVADPRRAAVEVATSGKPLVLLTAVLTAAFAALLVGHVGGFY